MIGLTLQRVTESAMAIQACITVPRFAHKEAEQNADHLYDDALKLVRAEINAAPLFDQNVLPVALTLGNIVSDPNIQLEDDLHKALSKTYRIFIELTWYQCWRAQNRPVFSKDIKGLIDNSNEMLKIIDKTKRTTRFEYSCARQAARYLKPSDSMWTKYLELFPSAAGAAVNLSVGEMLDILVKVLGYAKHDWMKGWYPAVHYLRWITTDIRTVNDFEKNIAPRLVEYKDTGGKHTQCVAAVCFELINNPEVDDACRQRAALELSSLLQLVDRDRISRILTSIRKHILPKSKFVGCLVQKADRYYKTREMVKQYLEILGQRNVAPTCSGIFRESLNALRVTNHSLTRDEVQEIQSAIQELDQLNEEDTDKVEYLNIMIEDNKGDNLTEDQKEKTKEDIAKLNKTITVRDEELEWIRSLENDFSEVQAQEKNEIENLLKLIQ